MLAERAAMTVRNVRAYSTRGLIEPPRLEGRTGYYGESHLQRLILIHISDWKKKDMDVKFDTQRSRHA